MADTQPAPQEEVSSNAQPGSIQEAEEAFLKMINPPPEDTEESEETQASEEVSEDEPEPSESRVVDESQEETEDEAEEEEDSEESLEEEEPEDESETETVYTVRIDGKDVEVTEDELLKGYSRQADYTKKTQELAEYRRQMDTAVQQAQQEIQQTQQARAQYVDAVEAAISSNYAHLQQFQHVDWERLKELQNQHKAAAEQQQAEMAEQHKRMWMEEHQKMSQILPEWRDDEKRMAISKAIGEYAVGQGYTKEELDTLVDHRSILMLMKAKAYDDVQKKQRIVRSKKVKNKPKVVRSKAKQEKAPSKARKRAAKLERLRDTGHVDDAAEAIFEILEE